MLELELSTRWREFTIYSTRHPTDVCLTENRFSMAPYVTSRSEDSRFSTDRIAILCDVNSDTNRTEYSWGFLKENYCWNMFKYGSSWKRCPSRVLVITEYYKVKPNIRKLSRHMEVLFRWQGGVKDDVKNNAWKLLFTIDIEFGMEGTLWWPWLP